MVDRDIVANLINTRIDDLREHVTTEVGGMKTLVNQRFEELHEHGCGKFNQHLRTFEAISGPSLESGVRQNARFRDLHPVAKTITIAGGAPLALTGLFELVVKLVDHFSKVPIPGK